MSEESQSHVGHGSIDWETNDKSLLQRMDDVGGKNIVEHKSLATAHVVHIRISWAPNLQAKNYCDTHYTRCVYVERGLCGVK